MAFGLHSPLKAAGKTLFLLVVVYALGAPVLAPLRPEAIDRPLSAFHQAVNDAVLDPGWGLDTIKRALLDGRAYLRRQLDMFGG